jgi:hypothetical protein
MIGQLSRRSTQKQLRISGKRDFTSRIGEHYAVGHGLHWHSHGRAFRVKLTFALDRKLRIAGRKAFIIQGF